MIGFQLGREYKLSVAEILAVFPEWKTVYMSKDFLVLDGLDKNRVIEKANYLWWTIKIVKIINNEILDIALLHEWKFKYGISIFGEKKNLKDILIKQKKILKSNDISSRFVNKDFKNLTSAQIIWEKLIKSGSDFSYIYCKPAVFIWKTIWVQNIYEYSKRDYGKQTDMQVGMLPPKLCQMMINIAWWKTIYDPFVWLWTILIESILMWNKSIYWSDLSDLMVDKSIININWFIKDNKLELEDNKIIKLNAKFIHESEILLNEKLDSIVTEWYLWEVMTKKNISLDRINKQKDSLAQLYERFFEWLKKIKYKWNLVICFPFWELKSQYVYFTDIYDIINKYCKIEKIFPEWCELEVSKSWSLLYKREKQLVWRDIFKLTIKD